MYFLTPPFLVDPAARSEGGPWVGVALSYAEGVLLGHGMDRQGKVWCGPVVLPRPEEVSRHLLVIPGTPPAEGAAKPPPDAWWLALEAVERAHKAARLGRWEEFGKYVDRAYAVERGLLEPSQKRDLAYAAARSAGAWGGRPAGGGLVLVAPENLHETIKKEVEKYL